MTSIVKRKKGEFVYAKEEDNVFRGFGVFGYSRADCNDRHHDDHEGKIVKREFRYEISFFVEKSAQKSRFLGEI